MRNKLLVGVAMLAIGIAAASCEKTPNEEPAAKQSGSATSEGQQSQSAQAEQRGAEKQGTESEPSEAQQRSSRTATQAPGEGEEQQTKGGQQEQKPQIGQDGSKPDQQDRTGAPSQSSAQSAGQGQAQQPNQPQPNQAQVQPNQAQVQTGQAQSQAQLNEQKSQPGPDQQASANAAGGALNVSRDQVRQAQMVLNGKGFDAGDPDGVLGPRTRKALIAFQRQQSLQPSGQIDQRTATALGISNGPSSTRSGQGGAGAQ
jgi:hypothetical protein